jgi:hypothetical protein
MGCTSSSRPETELRPAEAGRFEEIVNLGLKSFGSRFGHLEVFVSLVGLRSLLLADVLQDHLVRHIPAAGDEVPSRPEMPPPELSLDVFELQYRFSGTFPLDVLHYLRGRQVGRARQQQVDMVRRHRSPQDLDLVRPTNLPHQCSAVDPKCSAVDPKKWTAGLDRIWAWIRAPFLGGKDASQTAAA